MSKTITGTINAGFRIVFSSEEVKSAEAQIAKELEVAKQKQEAKQKLSPGEHAVLASGGDVEKLFQLAVRAGIRELLSVEGKDFFSGKGSIKVTFDAPRS